MEISSVQLSKVMMIAESKVGSIDIYIDTNVVLITF